MNKICNDLIEAYKGYYEDEIIRDYNQQQPIEMAGWESHWVANKIQSHSPKERLEVYLEWNGILGWTNRIWEISQGEIYVA